MRDSEYKKIVLTSCTKIEPQYVPKEKERYTKIEIIEERQLPSHLSLSRSRENIRNSRDKIVHREEISTIESRYPFQEEVSSLTRVVERVSRWNQQDEMQPRRIREYESTVIYNGKLK